MRGKISINDLNYDLNGIVRAWILNLTNDYYFET